MSWAATSFQMRSPPRSRALSPGRPTGRRRKGLGTARPSSGASAGAVGICDRSITKSPAATASAFCPFSFAAVAAAVAAALCAPCRRGDPLVTRVDERHSCDLARVGVGEQAQVDTAHRVPDKDAGWPDAGRREPVVQILHEAGGGRWPAHGVAPAEARAVVGHDAGPGRVRRPFGDDRRHETPGEAPVTGPGLHDDGGRAGTDACEVEAPAIRQADELAGRRVLRAARASRRAAPARWRQRWGESTPRWRWISSWSKRPARDRSRRSRARASRVRGSWRKSALRKRRHASSERRALRRRAGRRLRARRRRDHGARRPRRHDRPTGQALRVAAAGA